jgi:adenylosuccinate synthase
LDEETLSQEMLGLYAQLRSYVREPFGLIQDMLAHQGNILLEGAQGALLDNNWGTYPYCTASHPLSGSACAGLGIAPHWLSRVVGVAKAYTTRVGSGPMPTELNDETGKILQNEGQEFGTVTGRPRRCGWFDAALVRFTTQLNGVTDLALTKLDVLDTLDTIRLCTGYRLAQTGERLWHYWELDAQKLAEVIPVYIEMEGWKKSTRAVREFAGLPPQAQAYVRRVEELLGTPVRYVSVGPEREATIHIPV